MEPLIIDTIIEKVDANDARLVEQEKAISEISQNLAVIEDQANTINHVGELVNKLQENMYNIRWPVKEMKEMSSRLDLNNELLANPRKTKQVIFHTAGKLLWVIIGLSVGMVFLILGWVNTLNKLDQFRMHDIQWRYIKLTNQDQNLEYLQWIEKLYQGNPEEMESIVLKEELSQEQLQESNPKSTKDYPSLPKSQIHINTKIKQK
jgi:hypothetical protein